MADYYDAVARATGESKLASNWIQQDVLRTIKEKKLALAEFPVRPDALADLINRVKRGELNTNQGREVLGRMIETGEPAEVIIEAGGYGMVSDRDQIAAAVEAAMAANPKAIDDLKGGKKKPDAVKGFLRGQVMKQTGGKADPALVGELLDARLAELLRLSALDAVRFAFPNSGFRFQSPDPSYPRGHDHECASTAGHSSRRRAWRSPAPALPGGR